MAFCPSLLVAGLFQLKWILNIRVVDKNRIGQCVQESDDIGSLRGREAGVMALHRETDGLDERIFVDDAEAVVVVLSQHFFKR